MNYENKFLKYIFKNKHFKQLGGIIGDIPLNKLDQVIKTEDLPDEIKRCIDIMAIPKSHVIPVGSGTLRIQRFPSDVDVMNIVEKQLSTDDVLTLFIDNIKRITNVIQNDNNILFSDFKAGRMHWTTDEILNEVKNNISLRDACKVIDVIKLDMFVPYNRRYIEMSTFYILKSNTGFINVNENYFDNFEESLFNDIQTYRDSKPFKAVKRLWSMSRIRNDLETMNKLEVLINSNVSLLSQINADVETLELMIKKNSKYNKDFVLDEIKNFKDRTSHILDIEYNEKLLYQIIDNLVILFTNNESNEILVELHKLHDYILSIINRETINYLNIINFKLPDTFTESIIPLNTIFSRASIGAPNASVPNTGILNRSVPNTNVSNTNISHTGILNTTVPNTYKPNTHLPSLNLPNTYKPNTHLPSLNLPNTDKPNTYKPNTYKPSLNLPNTDNVSSKSIVLSMMIFIAAFML